MHIRSWGSRGSIPVSGERYLKYGGDTTCLEIRPRTGEILIVDAGTGIRRLGNHLLAENRRECHFIFTHAHWDHVMGFPFFKPAFSEKYRLLMHRCPFQSKFVETVLTKVMSPPYFPVRFGDLKAEMLFEDACPMTFDIGSVRITPVPISHPNCGSGYKFQEDGKTFVFLTDNELGHKHKGGLPAADYERFCRDADLLIHDAEYIDAEYRETRTWGHSTYGQALELALRARVGRLGLFHLNQDRSDAEVDDIVSDCGRRIQGEGSRLECFAVSSDWSITL